MSRRCTVSSKFERRAVLTQPWIKPVPIRVLCEHYSLSICWVYAFRIQHWLLHSTGSKSVSDEFPVCSLVASSQYMCAHGCVSLLCWKNFIIGSKGREASSLCAARLEKALTARLMHGKLGLYMMSTQYHEGISALQNQWQHWLLLWCLTGNKYWMWCCSC